MPLEEKFRRLYGVMQSDIARTREKLAARTQGHDGVAFDDGGNVAFTRGNAIVWRARAELVAGFTPELNTLRWAWGGASAGGRMDAAYREAQRYSLAELMCTQLAVDGEEEARRIIDVAAQLARSEGVVRQEDGTRILYYALFDGRAGQASDRAGSWRPAANLATSSSSAPGAFTPAVSAWSVAPPALGGATPGGPALRRSATGVPVRTLAPVAAIDVSPESEPAFLAPPPPPLPTRTAQPQPVREPTREIFFPVAQCALAAVAHAMSHGFKQALLVVTIDLKETKGRFLVQLVASDANGDLVALEPARDLLDATAKMIADDARDGNGRWRRLVARLTATERGASVAVEVR